MAAFAAMETAPYQPGRIRLDTPSAAKSSPKLELALAVPARIEEERAPEPQPAVESAPVLPVLAPPAKLGCSPSFPHHQSPRRCFRNGSLIPNRARDEAFRFDDPAVPARSTSGDAWRAMLSGWAPPAAVVSGMFAVLFLFSVVAIFLSAPSVATLLVSVYRELVSAS